MKLHDARASNDILAVQRGPRDTVRVGQLMSVLSGNHWHCEGLRLLKLHSLDVLRPHSDNLHRSSLVLTTGISATKVAGSGW